MKKILILFIALSSMVSCNNESKWTIKSPDGKIEAAIYLSESGQLSYTAKLETDGGTIQALEKSFLGIEREDASFVSGLSFQSFESAKPIRDNYTLVTGKKRNVSYTANEAVISLLNSEEKEIQVIFRVSNDALAFRYNFPENSDKLHVITKELSSFNLPDNGVCWSQAYDTISKWTPAYETYYEREMQIGTAADPSKNGWSFPTTFHTNDIWVLITESNLDGSYPASHLESNCEEGIYKIKFPEEIESFGKYSNKAEWTLPWSTPWRVCIIGETAASILESTTVTDLADPCKVADITWIKPGRSAWSWWSDSDSPQLVKEQKRFVDLAVEMGWEYNLIDANWDKMKDGDVRDAIEYGNKNNVGSILWYNSGGDHNIVTEGPRDRMWDSEIRAREFKMLSEWGVKGVKVDFFQSDKQRIINQYIGILEDAAENHVMVNFHGCTLPRGWRRTYPNMVTLEAVRGGEVYRFGKNYPEYAPWHNTVLAFTRNVVGPMDYTPVMLSDQSYAHLTSYAHELATSVIFESGIIHLADKVEVYLSLPEPVKNFLKEVPSVWDDVKFLDGYPGQFVSLARQNGSKWYIAGLNGNNDSKEFTLTLDFLNEGTYSLTLISDGDTDSEFSFKTIECKKGDSIKISTLPYGGFTGVLTAE